VGDALRSAGLSAEIIIVDDDSPDTTEEICARLAQEYPVRVLIRKEERGLSSAVLHGMRHAAGTIIVVMDADLSHPPEKVPELVAAVQRPGVDFVIGSRYASGGEVADGWGLGRWLNSKVATLLCRPLTAAADPMAGFFAIRREGLASAAPLDPIGYKIGLELLVKCRCQNVVEVPITFQDRRHGDSKLNLREQINYLRHLRRLYAFKLGAAAGPVQFALIGLTGLGVDMSTFALLLAVMPLPVARACAIATALTWNFWLNRRLTFAHARSGNVLRQYLLFALSCSLGALTSWTTSMLLTYGWGFAATHPLVAAMAGVAVGAVSNYILCATTVFRPKRKSSGAPRPQIETYRVAPVEHSRMQSPTNAGIV
jgi:dolichol-phosphate mannosyltransferase